MGNSCFRHGEPVSGWLYGRIESTGGDRSQQWVRIPVATLNQIDIGLQLPEPGSLSLQQLSDSDRAHFLDHTTEVDWRELAVTISGTTPLTKRQADMYVLHRWFALPRQEIAELLDISPNTVDNHLQDIKGIEQELTDRIVRTILILDIDDDVATKLHEAGIEGSRRYQRKRTVHDRLIQSVGTTQTEP